MSRLMMYFQHTFNIYITNCFYIVVEVLWICIHVCLAVQYLSIKTI
jgi:hypothetical protein